MAEEATAPAVYLERTSAAATRLVTLVLYRGRSGLGTSRRSGGTAPSLPAYEARPACAVAPAVNVTVAGRVVADPAFPIHPLNDALEVGAATLPWAQTENLSEGDIASSEVEMLRVLRSAHGFVVLPRARPREDVQAGRL